MSQIQTFEVESEFDGERVDKFLTAIYQDQSRSFFQKLIKVGNVVINDKVVTKSGAVIDIGDLVTVEIPDAQSVSIEPEDIPLDIIYEDDDVLIVNKPKGMVVHPAAGHYSGTLVNAIMYHCADQLSGINGEIRPGIVHRIDMDTTGSLIVCKNDHAHNVISEQIKEHSCNRRYCGIVCGHLKDEEGVINANIGRHPTQRKKMAVCAQNQGRTAVTHYKLLKRLKNFDFVEFQLETGRTHQIRVHMQSIGHPLLGDELYGIEKTNAKHPHLQGQCLHARHIGFVHPTTREYVEYDAPIPEYMLQLIERV